MDESYRMICALPPGVGSTLAAVLGLRARSPLCAPIRSNPPVRWFTRALLLLVAGFGLVGGPSISAQMKWHPGHYILVDEGKFPSTWPVAFDDIQNEPAVVGVQVRYRWKDLEGPGEGEYHFDRIVADLKHLEGLATPKRLVVQIMERDFGAIHQYRISAGSQFWGQLPADKQTALSFDPIARDTLPEYLFKDPRYAGPTALGAERCYSPTRTGIIARLWDPDVMDRLGALWRALARRFDQEEHFEGITLNETGLGFSTPKRHGPGDPPDYTDAIFGDQVARLFNSTRPALARTNVFAFTSYLGGQVSRLVAAAADNYIAVGAPDTVPANWRPCDQVYANRRSLTDASPFSDDPAHFPPHDYRGEIPMGRAVQRGVLVGDPDHDFPRTPPEEIIAFANDYLHANYLFWIRLEGGVAGWHQTVLPALRRHPLTHTATPARFPLATPAGTKPVQKQSANSCAAGGHTEAVSGARTANGSLPCH